MYIICPSTRDVIKVQKCLQANQIETKVKAMPQSMAKECGMSLWFDASIIDLEKISQVLEGYKYRLVDEIK